MYKQWILALVSRRRLNLLMANQLGSTSSPPVVVAESSRQALTRMIALQSAGKYQRGLASSRRATPSLPIIATKIPLTVLEAPDCGIIGVVRRSPKERSGVSPEPPAPLPSARNCR